MCDLPAQIPFLIATLHKVRWGVAEGATSYSLEVSRDNGLTWVAVPQLFTTTETTLPRLSQNTEYAFRVRGKNSCGFGSYSQIVYRHSPNNPSNVGFIWSTPVRDEPNLQEGVETDWIKKSEFTTIVLNEQNVVSFLNGTQLTGILVISRESVDYEENDEGVTFYIPQNSIIIGDAGTHQSEEEEVLGLENVVVSKSAKKKTFIEKITGKTYVLDENGIDGFASAGFTTTTIEDGLPIQTLREKGLLSSKGIFFFRLNHIVSGSGYAYIKLATSSSFQDRNVAFHGGSWTGPLMTATQNGESVDLVWKPTNQITKLWKRVNNGSWFLLSIVGKTEGSRTDHNINSNATHCYSVGNLPNTTTFACVYVI